MIWVPQYYMVEDFDFEKLSGSDEIASDFNVRFGRSWFTAWMIVRDHDCCGARHNSKPKDLPWMTKNCIHFPNRHQVVPLDAATGVEDENHQTSAFRIEVRMIRNVRSPMGGWVRGGVSDTPNPIGIDGSLTLQTALFKRAAGRQLGRFRALNQTGRAVCSFI